MGENHKISGSTGSGRVHRLRQRTADGAWQTVYVHLDRPSGVELPRAQRRRPRPLSRRGRATLTALFTGALGAGALCGASLHGALEAERSAREPSGELRTTAIRPVAPPEQPSRAPSRRSEPARPAPVSFVAEAPAAILGDPPVTRERFERLELSEPNSGAPRLVERVAVPDRHSALAGPLRVQYAIDPDLSERVFEVLRRGRVEFGHVIAIDPRTGRVLAYASTDLDRFAPTRPYPAASLIKVVTAAAVLARTPAASARPCRTEGSPYALTRARLAPLPHGAPVSMRRALASSNNQCFAQLAVNSLGRDALVEAISRFGFDARPAPGHEPGRIDPGHGALGLGKLGCGLAGCRITPLHAARLAATLARGELVEPFWVERVTDARGRELALPVRPQPRRVMSRELAEKLRSMLVETTVSGTARRAFRARNGGRLLGAVDVAGKTGSLTARDPDGRYEWFMGVAPADDPRIAIAVLTVHGDLYWTSPTQIAAEILRFVFCSRGTCSADRAQRFARVPASRAVDVARGAESRARSRHDPLSPVDSG